MLQCMLQCTLQTRMHYAVGGYRDVVATSLVRRSVCCSMCYRVCTVASVLAQFVDTVTYRGTTKKTLSPPPPNVDWMSGNAPSSCFRRPVSPNSVSWSWLLLLISVVTTPLFPLLTSVSRCSWPFCVGYEPAKTPCIQFGHGLYE